MRPQSLYSYFDSKNEIYDAMCAQGCRQFVDGQLGWELMFQRTVPGFEPSAASFAISEQSLGEVIAHLAALGIDDLRDIALFTAIGTGLTDQQISNDPGGDRWVRLPDDTIDMYVDHVTKRSRAIAPTKRKTRSR